MNAADAIVQLARAGALRDVDRAFARLLRRMEGTPEVALAGALAMRAVALGHGGFVLDDAQALLEELDADAALPEAGEWAAALRASPLVADESEASAPLVFQHGLVALRRYARYEQRLAGALRARRGAFEDAVDAVALARLFGLQPGILDRQALAAWIVLRQRLALVTGGPGTGKTTTVARMLALLAARTPDARIALAAPTGRAAARLAEAVAAALDRDVAAGRLDPDLAARVPRTAQTLHRLLGWQRSGHFRHDATLPLPFDVVVVDEASMVDLPMMARLVDAVVPAARLVLLGDPDQLPAVETGDVLGALCAAAGDGESLPADAARAASAALQGPVPDNAEDAPLAGHRIHLTRGYRQANAEGIAALARAVQRGDAGAAMDLLRVGTEGVQWIDAVSSGSGPVALEQRIETEILPAYRALAQAPDPQAALRLATRLRVLTALRHGHAGAATWNAWFAQRLGGGETWFQGRLLMITANSYRHGLFNGDTGVCWPDADGNPAVWFEQGGRMRSWSPGQLPHHDTAFATTVHKAQGSEFDDVWLLLPARDNRALSRELLYTALTRARRALHVCAGEPVLRAALGRHGQRVSGLAARLRAAASAQ